MWSSRGSNGQERQQGLELVIKDSPAHQTPAGQQDPVKKPSVSEPEARSHHTGQQRKGLGVQQGFLLAVMATGSLQRLSQERRAGKSSCLQLNSWTDQEGPSSGLPRCSPSQRQSEQKFLPQLKPSNFRRQRSKGLSTVASQETKVGQERKGESLRPQAGQRSPLGNPHLSTKLGKCGQSIHKVRRAGQNHGNHQPSSLGLRLFPSDQCNSSSSIHKFMSPIVSSQGEGLQDNLRESAKAASQFRATSTACSD